MKNNSEKILINNFIEILISQAQDAKLRWLESKGKETERFDAGVVQGYWQVLTSLKSRLEIYGVTLDKYNLDEIEPDEICWK